jgi:hypothetical protein
MNIDEAFPSARVRYEVRFQCTCRPSEACLWLGFDNVWHKKPVRCPHCGAVWTFTVNVEKTGGKEDGENGERENGDQR